MPRKFKRVLKWPALYIVASILVLGLLALLRTAAASQGNPGILQPEDLPAGAVILTHDLPSSDEIGHPLYSGPMSSLRSQLYGKDQNLIFGYKAARRFAALLPAQGVIVIEFAYEYGTVTEAEQAAQVLQDHVQGAATLLHVKDFQRAKGLRGRGFLLKGDEGDSVYWFIGSQGKSLILLLVNGMEQSSVSSAFDLVVQKLMDK